MSDRLYWDKECRISDILPTTQRSETSIALPPANPVEVVRTRYEAGFDGAWHHSPLAQLIYPSRGTMALYTRGGLWVVPPLRACWLPAYDEHRVAASTGFEMHSVYCQGALLRRLPARCGIVTVTGLLREIIFALDRPRLDRTTRLLQALFAEEVVLEAAPRLFLPPLTSPRLRTIETALREDPASGRSLGEWSKMLGTTPRTLARAFDREARMTFTGYRRQARLLAAIRRLADGEAVTSIAIDLGFGATSHFIKVFREATGVTPSRYFSGDPGSSAGLL